MPVHFIAIDGHGGSGKSTLANMLAERLNTEIIHIDDFTGADAPDNWHEKIIDNVFTPITHGETSLSYTPAQWWQEHTPIRVVDQPVTKIMILEGVGSLRREFAPYVSTKVFVDTPRSICLQRGLERDKGLDGNTDEQIVKKWNDWLDADEQYFARDKPKDTADFVVNGTLPFENIVDDVAEKIITA